MIYLYGAGGHAKVIIDILIAMDQMPVGIFDDFSNQDLLNGVPVIRYEPQLEVNYRIHHVHPSLF